MFFDTLIFMLLQTLKMFHDPVRKPGRFDVLGYPHTISFRNLRFALGCFLYTIFCKSFAISGLFQPSIGVL